MATVTEKKLDFMYDVLSKKLERQSADYVGVITKGNYLFAFSSAFFAGYLIFVFTSGLNILWNLPGFLLVIVTLYYINQVIKTRTFKDPPPVEHFFTNSTINLGIENIKNKTVASVNDSIKDNAKAIEEMSSDYEKARLLLFITFVTIMAINSFATYVKQQTPTIIPQGATTTTAIPTKQHHRAVPCTFWEQKRWE